MRNVLCYAENWTWHHPILTTALSDPDLTFSWGDTPSEGDAAVFAHSRVGAKDFQRPTVFHLEEVRSLFWGLHTRALDEIPPDDIIDLVRKRMRRYTRIVTHLRRTIPVLQTLMGSEIASKVVWGELGIEAYAPVPKPEPFRFLFTNSFHNGGNNFSRRGGREVLQAFRRVREKVKDVELILAVPDLHIKGDMDRIHILDRRLTDDAMTQLFAVSHCFLLPSYDLHAHSVVRAQAHGCIPIVSDAPGYEEFIRPGITGEQLVCADGVWWTDEATGMWLSTEEETRGIDEVMVEQLTETMLHFARNPDEAVAYGDSIRAYTVKRRPLAAWQKTVCGTIQEAIDGPRHL